MSARKRPGLIVMKRLDTMGLRLLSQAVGAGTRRAGVRLSPRGELTPHQRGEPILGAPLPEEPEDDAATATYEGTPETPAVIDATGALSAEIRALATAHLTHEIVQSRREDAAVAATSAAPAGLVASIAPPEPAASSRRATALWAVGLLGAGALTGVLIARLVSGASTLPSAPGVGAAMTVESTRTALPADAPRAAREAAPSPASEAVPASGEAAAMTNTPTASPHGAHASPPGPQLETAPAAD